MESVLANYSASISELKRNPSALIEAAEGEAVAILNHNKPTAYLIPAETYNTIIEQLEDYELGLIIKERQAERELAKEISLDEL